MMRFCLAPDELLAVEPEDGPGALVESPQEGDRTLVVHLGHHQPVPLDGRLQKDVARVSILLGW